MGKNSKPPSQRQLKVGEEMRHILSSIFLQENFAGTPIDGVSVTVSEVRISPDLKNASAYVSPLGGEMTKEFIPFLNEIAPHLRHMLGQKLTLRYTPKIFFKLDHSFDEAHRMEKLFESVKKSTMTSADPDA